jgi:putative membrane protein
MRIARPYTLPEFVHWTRRTLYVLLALNIAPALLYQFAGFTWLSIPWGVIFMLGTTVALSAGFKTLQTYNRVLEAQQIWSSIVSSSRIWGGLCRDLIDDPSRARELVYRHLAWLATLRHELRGARAWESANKSYNVEYMQKYLVEEHEESLQDAIARYVDPEDGADILSSRSKAFEVLNLQGRETNACFATAR